MKRLVSAVSLLASLCSGQAKFNVLRGRYPMKSEHFISLAGIQAAIHEGPHVSAEHTDRYYQ